MLQSAAYACAFLFSVTGFVSIAASHLFLGLAIVLLLASRTPVRFPPLLAPIGLFFAWTLVSAFASDDLNDRRSSIDQKSSLLPGEFEA